VRACVYASMHAHMHNILYFCEQTDLQMTSVYHFFKPEMHPHWAHAWATEIVL